MEKCESESECERLNGVMASYTGIGKTQNTSSNMNQWHFVSYKMFAIQRGKSTDENREKYICCVA